MSFIRDRWAWLVLAQLVGMVLTIVYAGAKRPLFVYTMSLSYVDALLSGNSSSCTLFFSRDTAQGDNPYLAQFEAARRPRHPHMLERTRPTSLAQVVQVNPKALFALPEFVACMFILSCKHVEGCGACADYGQHEVAGTLLWESSFWLFVALHHVLVQCVLGSPAELFGVLGTAFAATIMLLTLCLLAVVDHDAPGRRFDGVVMMALVVTYVVEISRTRDVLGTEFTLFMWLAHTALSGLLAFGHVWDIPTKFSTVLNCRSFYVVAACCLHICLYIGY